MNFEQASREAIVRKIEARQVLVKLGRVLDVISTMSANLVYLTSQSGAYTVGLPYPAGGNEQLAAILAKMRQS